MRVTQITMVSASSMAVNITTAGQQLNQMFGYAIQAFYTTSGTLGGTFKLQSSVDYLLDGNGNVLNSGHWDDVPGSSLLIAAAGSNTWNVADINYPFVRLVYTHFSGDTGSLTANFFGRGF